MGKWSVPIDQMVAKAGADVDAVVRKVTVDLFSRVISRSPVGNPELWAANADATYRRSTYNMFADRINDDVLSNAASYSPRTGNLKVGVKLVRDKSNKSLAKMFPLAAGKGYVGGRFRGNWQVSQGAAIETTIPRIDPEGIESTYAAYNAVMTLPTGAVTYLSNALPYAYRLEYEGWSKQAPAGMVRLTAREFDDAVQKAAAK